MSVPIPRLLVLPAVVAVALVVGLLSVHPSVAEGPGEHGADAFYIDMDPAGGATAVCARINVNGVQDADEDGIDSVDLDVVAGPFGIPGPGGMIAYAFNLNYPSSVLSVTAEDRNFLLHSGPNSGMLSPPGASDPLPDSDGTFLAADLDINTGLPGNVPEYGPGVLSRITLTATAATPGVYPLSLSSAAHVNPNNDAFAPYVVLPASVAINTACPTPPPDVFVGGNSGTVNGPILAGVPFEINVDAVAYNDGPGVATVDVSYRLPSEFSFGRLRGL